MIRSSHVRMMRCAGCGIVLLFACMVGPAVSSAELVDRIVAAVDNEVITLHDLRQAMAFNEEMSGMPRSREQMEAETLDGLINRRLLVHEARRLAFAEVTDKEVAAETEKVKNRLGSDAAYQGFLRKLDLTPDQLGRMLGERLLVERFIEKKFGLFVRIGREETQRYYDAHPEEFKGKSFPEVSKAITAALTQRKIDQQLAQHLAELRGKALIRINPR